MPNVEKTVTSRAPEPGNPAGNHRKPVRDIRFVAALNNRVTTAWGQIEQPPTRMDGMSSGIYELLPLWEAVGGLRFPEYRLPPLPSDYVTGVASLAPRVAKGVPSRNIDAEPEGRWWYHLASNQRSTSRKTDLLVGDEELFLLPGCYVVTGSSGAGKTNFVSLLEVSGYRRFNVGEVPVTPLNAGDNAGVSYPGDPESICQIAQYLLTQESFKVVIDSVKSLGNVGGALQRGGISRSSSDIMQGLNEVAVASAGLLFVVFNPLSDDIEALSSLYSAIGGSVAGWLEVSRCDYPPSGDFKRAEARCVLSYKPHARDLRKVIIRASR